MKANGLLTNTVLEFLQKIFKVFIKSVSLSSDCINANPGYKFHLNHPQDFLKLAIQKKTLKNLGLKNVIKTIRPQIYQNCPGGKNNFA